MFLGIALALLGFIIVFALFAFTPYSKIATQITEFVTEDVIISHTNRSGNTLVYVLGAILGVIAGVTGLMSFYVLIPGMIILISLRYSLSITAKRKNIWCAIMYAHEENV